MGIFLKNLDQLRTIQWSKSWKWDVKFPDGPNNFKEWFPATNVEETVFSLTTYTAGLPYLEVPKDKELSTLSLTFIDSIQLDVEDWLDHWINVEILNEGLYLSPLKSITKEIRIAKLDNLDNIVHEYGYLVYPKGVYNFSGNSESSTHSSQIEFVIASDVK